MLNFQHNHDKVTSDNIFKDYELVATHKRAIKEAVLKRYKNKLKAKKMCKK